MRQVSEDYPGSGLQYASERGGSQAGGDSESCCGHFGRR